MSRRNKPRTHSGRTKLAWPIIAFGMVLVGAAIFLFTRQAAGDGTPRLAADPQTVDYGYVKFGETRAIEISVRNTGDGVLRFGKKPYIEVLEGC